MKPRQFAFEIIEIVVRPGDEGDALGMRGDVSESQLALALLRAHLAETEEAREPTIARAVDRVSEQRGCVDEVETAANQRLQPRFLRCAVHPHHAGERVA